MSPQPAGRLAAMLHVAAASPDWRFLIEAKRYDYWIDVHRTPVK